MNKKCELQRIDELLEIDKDIDICSNEYKRIKFIYEQAMTEIENKIKVFQGEFNIFYNRVLIERVLSRIKSEESILKKMENKSLNFSYKDMINNINDIAGVRVVCPLKCDIYIVRSLITNLQGINIIKEKDYVRNPKESGYSSYHMIIEVPVSFSYGIIYVKVEIQIRTLAMDFWSSIEHKMKYKSLNGITSSKSKQFVKYSKILRKIDDKIMSTNT